MFAKILSIPKEIPALEDMHDQGQYNFQDIVARAQLYEQEHHKPINFTNAEKRTILDILCNKQGRKRLNYLDEYPHRLANLLGQVFFILIPPNRTPLEPKQITPEIGKIILKRLAVLPIFFEKNEIAPLLGKKGVNIKFVKTMETEAKQNNIWTISRMREVDGVPFFTFVLLVDKAREIIYTEHFSNKLRIYSELYMDKTPLLEILISNLGEHKRSGKIALEEKYTDIIKKSHNYTLKDIASKDVSHRKLYSRTGEDLLSGLYIELEPGQHHHFLVYE